MRRVHGRACGHHSLPVRAAWPGVTKWRPSACSGLPSRPEGSAFARAGRGRAAVALQCLAKVADSVAI